LGKDFLTKNNLIINFKDKFISLDNNDKIKMNNVWHCFNKNNISEVECISSINRVAEKSGKIAKQNLTIARKMKFKLDVSIKTIEAKKFYNIQPVEKLSKQKYLILKSPTVDNNASQVFVYDFSNVYTNIPEGMTIEKITYENCCAKINDDLLTNINNICNDVVNAVANNITDK